VSDELVSAIVGGLIGAVAGALITAQYAFHSQRLDRLLVSLSELLRNGLVLKDATKTLIASHRQYLPNPDALKSQAEAIDAIYSHALILRLLIPEHESRIFQMVARYLEAAKESFTDRDQPTDLALAAIESGFLSFVGQCTELYALVQAKGPFRRLVDLEGFPPLS
jgi:hypothetical protein